MLNDGIKSINRRSFLKMTGLGICSNGLATPLLQSCTTKDVEKFFEGFTKLAVLINDEREKNGLSRISLSDSMMAVALHHVMDLNSNKPQVERGSGSFHSWSTTNDWNGENGEGAWIGCCYSAEPSKLSCMHDKPKEITNYPEKGYEIVYWSSGNATPQGALASWMTSTKGHKDVILNQGDWKNFTWEALGAACGGYYACA